MHSFSDDCGNSAHYNSDFSGNVILVNDSNEEFSVPCRFILDFVSNYVASERIAKLQRATTKEILGL